MKTFDEILKERQSSYQDINNEISKAEYNDIDLKKKVAELVESKMTDSPNLKPVFDINERNVHEKVTATVSALIGTMIKEGNNDYRIIVKILEATVALVSLMNQYDIVIREPKFKKNVDITSKIMGMTSDEYNILINKELNGYKQAIENQCTVLNKLLNTKIELKIE